MNQIDLICNGAMIALMVVNMYVATEQLQIYVSILSLSAAFVVGALFYRADER